MERKSPYRDRPGGHGLLFPPSAYVTCATVNVYKSATADESFFEKRAAERVEKELAEELRNWSIENRL